MFDYQMMNSYAAEYFCGNCVILMNVKFKRTSFILKISVFTGGYSWSINGVSGHLWCDGNIEQIIINVKKTNTFPCYLCVKFYFLHFAVTP